MPEWCINVFKCMYVSVSVYFCVRTNLLSGKDRSVVENVTDCVQLCQLWLLPPPSFSPVGTVVSVAFVVCNIATVAAPNGRPS